MEKIAEGVWGVRGTLKLGAGFYFPIRTTILQTESGLVVISPIQVGAWMDEVDRLGSVRFVVAPNGLHHLFAGAARERWPEARLLRAEVLKKKRADLKLDGGLGELPAGIKGVYVKGAPDLDETVFFHEASKSLVVTDLIFHILKPEGWLTPWVLRLGGVNGRLGQSRLIRFYVKDRAAFAGSAVEILKMPIERVVPAHGEVLDGAGAKERFSEALAWMRAGLALN